MPSPVKQPRPIRMAIPAGWGPLTPPKQSTYMASEILTNVYQTLVAYDLQGNLRPQLAQSWHMSRDLRTLEFRLDTTRRFSNGALVAAPLAKSAFEHSLTVVPTSAKQSALDLLYKVEGIEAFDETKGLSGIEAPNDETLIFHFKEPFRLALSFLTGIRYAVYLLTSAGEYLGTGPYQFGTVSEHEVLLTINPYAATPPAFPRAEIVGVPNDHWDASLCDDRFDVFWVPRAEKLPACARLRHRSFIETSGSVAAHRIVEMNALPGRIFSNRRLRQAAQYLILRHGLTRLSEYVDLERAAIDPQFLLPLMSGRLTADEMDALIDSGAQWVDALIAASKQSPISFAIRGREDHLLVEALTKNGVHVIASDRLLANSEIMARHYKTYDFDLMTLFVGFGSSDPDNLYHYLGEHGAISSPASGRMPIWEIMERGRSLMDPHALQATYSDLSRAIFREVPAIHLAFNRAGVLYASDTMQLRSSTINSTRFDLSQFVPH